MLTSFKADDSRAVSIINEFTAIAVLMFMSSSVLSYLSMRTDSAFGCAYERIADIVFLSGLGFLFITTMLITLNVIE